MGAGVVAGLCIRLRDDARAGSAVPQPLLQLLVYPMLDDREVTSSIRALAEPGHWGLWHLQANRMVWEAYLGSLSGTDAVPGSAAPAREADLRGLAPVFLSIGDVDGFLDESIEYAGRLSNAGVPVELHVYPGVIHGGFGGVPRTPRTAQMLRDVYGALAYAFDTAREGPG